MASNAMTRPFLISKRQQYPQHEALLSLPADALYAKYGCERRELEEAALLKHDPALDQSKPVTIRPDS